MGKKIFSPGKKISGRNYILETSGYLGSSTCHINVCLVAEKNITVIMVSVCFDKKLIKKKSLLMTYIPHQL